MSVTSPSFLQSVLAGAVGAELSDLSVIVKNLERSIQLLQVEVETYFIGRYAELDIIEVGHDTSDELLSTAQNLTSELADADARIAAKVNCDLDTSTNELQLLQESLNEAKSALLPVLQLLFVENGIQLSNQARSELKYIEAAKLYSESKSKLHKLLHGSEPHKHLHLLEKELPYTGVPLQVSLDMLWRKCVSWNESDMSPSLKSTVLNVSNSHILNDTLRALYCGGFLNSAVSLFGNHLMKVVLIPITSRVTTVEKKKFEDHVQLCVKTVTANTKPHFSLVTENLTKVFDFLEAELCAPVDAEYTCLNILGECISVFFLSEFSKTISSSLLEKDQSFDSLHEVIHKFIWSLNVVGFVPSDIAQRCIDKIRNELVVANCDSRSQILEKARDIMKKDLHDTVLIQENVSNSIHGFEQNGYSSHDDDKSQHGQRADNAFVFHDCRVSKWVVELVDFLGVLVNGGLKKSFGMESARRVVSLYLVIVPDLHRESIESRPLEVALHYNNCMFLAHHLTLPGLVQPAQTPSKELAGKPPLMTDLIQRLKKSAVESIFAFFNKERKTVTDAVKCVDLAQLNKNRTDFEDSVKGCLKLVEDLHSVWSDVLSEDECSKFIGGLVSSWLEELIALVISADHVPDSDAQVLITVYKSITDEVSKLFKVHSVSRWNRFNALVDILGSTPGEIEMQWASGSLSREFRPEHINTFILARFRGSPAAADVTARIK